jgi:hypothetical protein
MKSIIISYIWFAASFFNFLLSIYDGNFSAIAGWFCTMLALTIVISYERKDADDMEEEQ